ncbi:MAG: type II secretion system protein [Nitrospirae bacterium]|nr:type II secretion system protein [Nitrospirota bacterium]
MRPDPSRRGFTLLELVIVMLIMGIAAGVTGIVVARKSGGTEIKKAAREISASLRFARSRAISEKKSYFFIVNNVTMTYGLYDAGMDKNKDLANLRLKKELPRDLRRIGFNKIVPNLFQIEFTPQGGSSAGVMEIMNESKKYVISVSRLTGRVNVENPKL